MSPRTGRPTNNPKSKQIGVRLDEECIDIIDKYTKQENVDMAEATRRGIKKLKSDLKQ